MTDNANEASDHAVRWLIRQDEPDWSDEQQQEFNAWIAASTLNRVAYLRQREGWRAADRLASLGAASFASITSASSFRSRPLISWAIAACLLLMVTAGTLRSPITMPKQTFVTQVGARHDIPLNDGSKVELNTATIIHASISDERREVWLDKGEAYFEIAHKNGLPFVVHAGIREITVLGTRFSVRRDGAKLTVAVAQGRVQVDDGNNPQAVRSAIITAGDVAIARGPSTLVAVRAPDQVERLLAWRDGVLMFSDTRLADVASEFNRYHNKPIYIADARTANMRIDGAFQASNVDAFVRLLHDAYALKKRETPNGIEISGP